MEITAQEVKEGSLSEARLVEALRAFRDTGLLTLENIYDTGFIAQMQTAYQAELERYLDAKGGLEALEGKTFGKNHIGFFPPLRMPFAAPQIAAHPLVVPILQALLGKDVQCSFYHTNTAYPGSSYQPIHRDSPPLFGTEMQAPHPVTSLVLNIPLCDFTVENGSTEVWPGTHLLGDSSPEETKELEARAALLPSQRLNLRAGALALRDLRVWHRGMPNQADYPRTMFAIVYQRGWLATKPILIPDSTWQDWTEEARHIFRKNTVVPDAEYRPATWDDMK